MTATKTSGPSHGSATLNADGTFTYTPTAGYTGPDSFQYKVNDGHVDSNTATVSITVINRGPVANNNTYSIGENTPLIINSSAAGVLENDTDVDSDALLVVIAGAAQGATGQSIVTNHGVVNIGNDGRFTYYPDANYFGPDSFQYQATDGLLTSNTATVSINVTQPDIALDSFTATGLDLNVNYAVSGGVPAAYSIAIYASSNGTTLDQELWRHAGGTDVGAYTMSFQPSFDDWQDDYYLVAVVDCDHDVAETNENNNWSPFTGGVFLVHNWNTSQYIVQIQGTAADDTVSVDWPYPSPLQVTFNGQTYYYALWAHDEIHFRGHGGNDTFTAGSDLPASVPLWLLGGDGDDNLTAAAAADYLFGGAGNDILDGGDGDDALDGGDGDDTLTGGSGSDTLSGDAGNDLLDAGDGNNSLDGGQGDDYLYADSGDNTLSGGDGSDTISAGNGANIIQAGDGNDYIAVGDGNNTIDAGAGDDSIETGIGDNIVDAGQGNDTIDTGSGDNDIEGGDGNDQINGLIDRPTIDIDVSPQVYEGHSLSVIVWLSTPTDHDVTATLVVQPENFPNSPPRWQQTETSVVIPAGESYAIYWFATVDDELLNGTNLSTVFLANPDGADLGNSSPAPTTVVDNDEGIGLDWDIPVDPDSDSSFNDVVRATTNGDGSLDAQGYDNQGRSFHAHITINRDTLEQTIDLTIDGLPTGDDHWTGTSDGHEEFNGRFPMSSDSGNGGGDFAAILADCNAEDDQIRTLSANLVTKVLDKELLDNYSGASGMPLHLNRKQTTVQVSKTNHVIVLYERQSYKIKYTINATTQEITVLSSDEDGDPVPDVMDISVPPSWLVSQANMGSYVDFALPVKFWLVSNNTNDLTVKVLKKSVSDKTGPVQIKPDSNVPGGQKK